MTRLADMAAVIRSKNASPFLITVDVFFNDSDAFDRVRSSGRLEAPEVARLHRLEERDVIGPFWDDSTLGVKVTFVKRPSAGYPGCTDALGAHQYILIADLEIPADTRTASQ